MKLRNLYKIISFFVIVAVCMFCISARSQQNSDEPKKESEPGRSNPFGQLPRLTKPAAPPVVPEPVEVVTYEPPELFVQTVMLKFLDAKSLMLAIGNMTSEYGTISTNEKNNSLIICDTKENLERIVSEIAKADKTPQQIMIEVVILDVQLNDDTEIGLNWDILSDKMYDISYRQNFTSSRLGSTVEDATTISDASAFNTTGLGGSFSVISGNIRNVIHLIQQKRDVEILASPRVMLVSGESASIEAVEELPYTEIMDAAAGGAAALTTTKFKNVGIQLNVEATLTDSNDIFLVVVAEQNVATGQSETEVPIVDTRKANTSLLLKDGQVVIFGGLRRQEKTREVDQIPILGDLPIVGFLFRSTNTIIKNSELIVFLSPRIYRDESVPEDAMSKYRQITDKPVLMFPEDSMSKANRDRYEQRAVEYETAVEELRQEIAERRRATSELKVYCNLLEKDAIEHMSTNEELRQKIDGHGQSERNVTKKILLDKIKILQQRKDREASKELLSSLALLDEILSQEINETITSSEKVIANEKNAVDEEL